MGVLHFTTGVLYWSGTSQDQVIQQREFNVRELMINNSRKLLGYSEEKVLTEC